MKPVNIWPAFPPEGSEILEALKNEVVWLHAKHKIWSQLYDTDENRIMLMNNMAKNFFAILQRVLMGDVVMSLARLTDPPAMGRKKEKQNLTISRLLIVIKKSCPPEMNSDLTDRLSTIHKACKELVGWRNRVLAHNDLATALNRELVPRVEREQIAKVLTEIRALMNQIDGYFFDSAMGYEHVLLTGDGDTIIKYLEDAKTFRKAQLESLSKQYHVSLNEES